MFIQILILAVCGIVGALVGNIWGNRFDEFVLQDSPNRGIGTVFYTTHGFFVGMVFGLFTIAFV